MSVPQGDGRRWRVGILGHTGCGDYGHGLDVACAGMPELEVVAVADPDAAGRAAAAARTSAPRRYADYRQMLAHEALDLAVVAPRHVGEHAAMLDAAIDAGAHVYAEKPLVATLAEADRVLDRAAARGTRIAVALMSRAYASLARLRELVRGGAIGRLRLLRAYGKCDRRGGGQDLVVLGTHLLDLMRFFAGDPLWVHAHFTRDGRDVIPGDARPGEEGVGPVAGDGVVAYFSFSGQAAGEFESLVAEDARGGSYFALLLHGTKGTMAVRSHGDRQLYVYDRPVLLPAGGEGWAPLELAGHLPEGPDDPQERYVWAHQQLIRDLMRAAERGREPRASGRDAAAALEMIVGAYQSHFSGARVAFPLADRRHPLDRAALSSAGVRP